MSGTSSGFLKGPVCPRNYCVCHCNGLLERVFFNRFVCWFLDVNPQLIKRPARDACLCMGELLAPPAPPAPAAPAAPPAPPAPHFVFLITL